jgi:imidazole glycerol-phosphate synthase subunit HisF
MLRKRLIFTLIYNNGFFTQSRNFRLQKVGDISWLEKNYGFKDLAFSLDELVILDASRESKNIVGFADTLSRLVEDVFIPICAGGGIRCMKDAEILFENGADKIILNTIIYENRDLVTNLIKKYGSQSIVASVDYKKNDVFIKNGTQKIDIKLHDYMDYINSLGVGEVYLNAMEKDGTGFGYDLETAKKVAKDISMPLIIAGGAGNEKHLIKGLIIDQIDAVATANLFNFIGNGLPDARSGIIFNNGNIAQWQK